MGGEWETRQRFAMCGHLRVLVTPLEAPAELSQRLGDSGTGQLTARSGTLSGLRGGWLSKIEV